MQCMLKNFTTLNEPKRVKCTRLLYYKGRNINLSFDVSADKMNVTLKPYVTLNRLKYNTYSIQYWFYIANINVIYV